MKYKCTVNYNGKYYKPGEEVPIEEKPVFAVEKQEVKAEETVAQERKTKGSKKA